MAKSVTIEVDVSCGQVSIADGALFLGEKATITFTGYTPASGNELFLSLFAHDRTTPVADNSTTNSILDLRYEELRKQFKTQAAQALYATVIERNATTGAWINSILASGNLYVNWSPVVFDEISGYPATLKGEDGADGQDGQDGQNGTNGTNGTNGVDGAQGAQGIQGIQGVKGDKGDKGDQGVQGEKGDKGDKGDQGVQGEKGDKGDQGEQGVQGIRGLQGLQGIQGDKGDKGDTGDPSNALSGQTMQTTPTQRQLTAAVKKIWEVLGGTVACLLIALTASAEVTRSTEWQDIPPETPVSNVVDLVDLSNTADKAFVTGKVAQAIAHTDAVSNNIMRVVGNKADVGAIDSMINDLSTQIGTKQDKLVSRQNIKTINNQSILGSGNITISGGGGGGGVSPEEAGEIATNVVRDLSLGGIWDTQLEVWWTPRMINGSLKYCATTNVNLNAEN